MDTQTALLTGASKGLGRALATALNDRGWRLVVDGRDAARLTSAVAGLPRPDLVTAVAGDVADPAHRAAPAAATGARPPPPTGRRPPRPPATASTSWSTTPASWARARCPVWPTSAPRSSSGSCAST